MSLKARLQALGRRRAGIPDSAAAPLPVSGPVRPVSGRRAGQLARGALRSTAMMSAAGGLPAPRPDQEQPTTPTGITAGTAAGTFRGRLVLVFGTGAGSGIFVYAGVPGAGNPPVFSVVAPGVTADPYGNTVGAVLTIGTFGGPGLNVDQFGNLALAGADGSLLELSPEANLPFALTSILTGVMQTLITAQTLDGAETQAGVISGLVLGTGATAKMATLITSPYAGEGMGILLQAQNDGATDTPWMTVGSCTTQGGTINFAPLFAFGPQVFLGYGSAGGIQIVTRTAPTTSTIPVPVNSLPTCKGETWGAGGSTSGASGGHSAIGGSGSGGYSAEPALACTPGGTLAYTTPVSGSLADTTLTGSAATVTAHPGQNGTINGFGNGAPASANTVARAGSRGGNPSFAFPGGGGGGGGSPGPAGLGGTGSAGSPTAGGQGGAGQSGGGTGGRGGNPTGNGVPGGSPAAGGGGGSTNASGAIGGQSWVRATFTLTGLAIILSHAAAAGTDQFGLPYQAGSKVPGPDGQLYTAGENTYINTAAIPIPASGFTPLFSQAVGIGAYKFSGIVRLKQGAVASTPGNVGFTSPATSFGVYFGLWSLQALANIGSQNATGLGAQTNVLGGQTVAGNEVVYWFKGSAVFTAVGTLVIGCQADGTHAFTAQPGCIFSVRPQ